MSFDDRISFEKKKQNHQPNPTDHTIVIDNRDDNRSIECRYVHEDDDSSESVFEDSDSSVSDSSIATVLNHGSAKNTSFIFS